MHDAVKEGRVATRPYKNLARFNVRCETDFWSI